MLQSNIDSWKRHCRPKSEVDPRKEEELRDLQEWDAQFWSPTESLCRECMPAGYARLLAELQAESVARGGGPTGTSGPMWCVKCGGPR